MMHDIAQEQPPTNCRACVLAGWMFKAAVASIFLGTTALTILLTITSAREVSEILALPLMFFAIGIVAVVGVFLTVALIAYPIRLFWKRPLSVLSMTVGSGLAGGLIYSAPMIISAYEAFHIRSGLMIGDGSTRAAINGVLALFAVGALYGGIFGHVYGRLEVHGQQGSQL